LTQYIHPKFLPEGQTLNADIMAWLLKGVNEGRPALYKLGIGSCSKTMHHRPKLSYRSSLWLNERPLCFNTPPACLTSSPPTSFSSPGFSLKGQYLQSIMEIQDVVTRELNSFQKEAFLEGIKNCMNVQIAV
jgi:hypothetical protein